MRTLKQSVIILDDQEQLEVRVGDLTVNIGSGRNGLGGSVRVSRPPTDGRFMRLVWPHAEPECRERTRFDEQVVISMVDIEAFTK